MLPLCCGTPGLTTPLPGPQHHPSLLNATHELDLCHGTARTAGKFRNRSKGATPGIQSESFQPQKPLRIKVNVCIWITYNHLFSCNTPPFNGKQWSDAAKKKLKEKSEQKILEQPNHPEEAWESWLKQPGNNILPITLVRSSDLQLSLVGGLHNINDEFNRCLLTQQEDGSCYSTAFVLFPLITGKSSTLPHANPS